MTVEPGIYIPEEKMGVRLENNVLVTETGQVDLMAGNSDRSRGNRGIDGAPPMTRGLDKGEVCILAGGLSDRMGRDKSRLRWRGKTLLQLVRIAARQTGRPVRVIRRDLVPRCGPLGGVYTALMTTRCERVLFLACDMPFVTGEFMEAVFTSKRPVFAQGAEGAGFPFLLPGSALPVVEEQLAAKRYSLQSLATRCRARKVPRARGRGSVVQHQHAARLEALEIQSKPCLSVKKP